MVNVTRLFEQEPPKQPLDGLKAIRLDFRWRFRDRNKTDQVVEFCRNADTFNEAVMRAVEARDANGKHHNHQSKVDRGARLEFGDRIILSHGQMLDAMAAGAEGDYTRFDAMYDFMDAMKPKGIGPVTVYDVAVRVGAFLKCKPTSVYLHAGVKEAVRYLIAVYVMWNALGAEERKEHRNHAELRMLWMMDADKMARIPRFALPTGLRYGHPYDADEVEDILCTYREVFKQWYTDLMEVKE
jgi:hypothetical protein